MTDGRVHQKEEDFKTKGLDVYATRSRYRHWYDHKGVNDGHTRILTIGEKKIYKCLQRKEKGWKGKKLLDNAIEGGPS